MNLLNEDTRDMRATNQITELISRDKTNLY